MATSPSFWITHFRLTSRETWSLWLVISSLTDGSQVIGAPGLAGAVQRGVRPRCPQHPGQIDDERGDLQLPSGHRVALALPFPAAGRTGRGRHPTRIRPLCAGPDAIVPAPFGSWGPGRAAGSARPSGCGLSRLEHGRVPRLLT